MTMVSLPRIWTLVGPLVELMLQLLCSECGLDVNWVVWSVCGRQLTLLTQRRLEIHKISISQKKLGP